MILNFPVWGWFIEAGVAAAPAAGEAACTNVRCILMARGNSKVVVEVL